jgi:endonuclease-8
LLLDQGFLAGLGNYLRSEILYVAGLPHDVALGTLDGAARLRLAESAFSITQQAYRCRGVTNDLARAARLKAEGMRYARYRHHVFARAGLECWTCDTAIRRADVSGRAVFFCPTCQSPRPARITPQVTRDRRSPF